MREPLTGEDVANLVWDLPDQLSPVVDEHVPCFKSGLHRAISPVDPDVEIKPGAPVALEQFKSVYLCAELNTDTVFAEYSFQHNPYSTNGPILFGLASLSPETQHWLFEKGKSSAISYCNLAFQLMITNTLIYNFVNL
jgi:hypothetical protein